MFYYDYNKCHASSVYTFENMNQGITDMAIYEAEVYLYGYNIDPDDGVKSERIVVVNAYKYQNSKDILIKGTKSVGLNYITSPAILGGIFAANEIDPIIVSATGIRFYNNAWGPKEGYEFYELEED